MRHQPWKFRTSSLRAFFVTALLLDRMSLSMILKEITTSNSQSKEGKAMRNTFKFGLFAALATFSLACTKATVEPTVGGNEKVQMTFTATSGAVTKTYLDGKTVKWHENDAISIFDGYSNTADASKVQKFTISSLNSDGSATFTGTVTPGMETYYATYPHDTGNYLKDGDIVRIGFKSTQKASAPGTFDQTYNPSAAILKDGVLNFQNLGGLLKFTLTQDNVKRVTLSAADSGTIGGVYYVTFDENGVIQSELGSARTSMALESTGSNFEPGTYYFALSARTYTGGLSISFTLTNGKVMTATTTQDVIVERSKITNIGTFDTTYVEEEDVFTPVTFPVVFPMGFKDGVGSNNTAVASNTWVQEWYNDDACSAQGKTSHKQTHWVGHHGTLYSATQPQATMKWVWDEQIASLDVIHFIETTTSGTVSTVGIKGIWTDDYFEFVLPVKDFEANTTLSLTMALYTRQGPTFWEVLYLDGDTWKSTAVDNLPAYAGAEVTARATWAIPYLASSSTTDNEQYVSMLFENAIKQGEIKIRVKCVDGSIISSGVNAVKTSQIQPYTSSGSAAAPFYIWNPGKREDHDIVIDIVNI